MIPNNSSKVMHSRDRTDDVAVLSKERNHCSDCKRLSRTKSAACQVDAPDISYAPLRTRSSDGDCTQQLNSYLRRRSSFPSESSDLAESKLPVRSRVASSETLAAGHKNTSSLSCWKMVPWIFFMVTFLAMSVVLWSGVAPVHWQWSSQNQFEQMSGMISALAARHRVLTRRYLVLHRTVHDLQRKIDNVGVLSTMQDDIRKVVDQQLAIYDADKLGLADYALESAGGAVVETPHTVTYYPDSWFELFGFPVFRYGPCHGPSCMLQPSMHPGNCWAFKGSRCNAKIHLARRIHIVAVTLEHIPRSIAISGDVSTAPKKFLVAALMPGQGKRMLAHTLGVYEYNITGPPLQTFRIQNTEFSGATNLVQLLVLENHGNPDYTCLYRVRVHGHEELPSSLLT